MISSIKAWFAKEDKSFIESLIETVIKVVPLAFLIRTIGFGLYLVPSGSMETTFLIGDRCFADKFTVLFRPIKRGEIISCNDPKYDYSSNPLIYAIQRYILAANWTKRVIGIPGDHLQGRIEEGKPVVYRNGEKLDERAYVNQLPLIYLWKKQVPTERALQQNKPGLVDIRSFDPRVPVDDQPFYKIDLNLRIKNAGQLFNDRLTYDTKFDAYLMYPDVPLSQGADVFDVYLGENEYWLMGDNRKGSDDSRSWGKLNGNLIHGRILFCFFSLQYTAPWSFLFFDESWIILDILLHPISFWKRIRWSRCWKSVQ